MEIGRLQDIYTLVFIQHIEESTAMPYVTFTTSQKIGSEVVSRIVGENIMFDGIKFLVTKEVMGEKI